jgi:two-component system, chemotaxis family, response regulator PixG
MSQTSTTFEEKEHRELSSSNDLEELLSEQSKFLSNGCLQIVYNSLTFFIYFDRGKLVYATNSLAPFERLERHLRRLSNHNERLTSTEIKQARQEVSNNLEAYDSIPSDYQGLCWLLKQNYLTEEEAATLVRRSTREVFEALLSYPQNCLYKFTARNWEFPIICELELTAYIEQCQKRLQAWQTFSDHIWSSYQRPYLVTESTNNLTNLTTEQNATICKLLKGLNFRQISAVIDKDELIVVKILYPSILNKTVIIRDPKPPFDRMPKFPHDNIFLDLEDDNPWKSFDDNSQGHSNSKETVQFLRKNWKIACVDDSANVCQNIKQFLDGNLFNLLAIEDSMTAFAKLIEFQPDLILLDVEMPQLNGYELCGLLRNHPEFKTLPIILLSEDPSSIDFTRMKLSGSAECMRKPLDKSDLFNVIFKYLQ